MSTLTIVGLLVLVALEAGAQKWYPFDQNSVNDIITISREPVKSLEEKM